MKKFLILLFLFLISAIIPFGCTSKYSNPTATNSSEQNVLNVYNYSTYIDPQVITEFEKKFDTKVNYDSYENSDDLYTKLKAGNPGYDVIFPSDYIVTPMGKENLLEKLNLNNIPNAKHIDQKLLNQPFDPENQYSLPYQWGTMGLGYNIKKTGKELDSWEAIFDPKFKGKVALMEEIRSMMGAVLIYLGYDPNTTNLDEINQAKDYIIKHKETIAAFTGDNGQLLLNQGEVDITVEWSGDILQIMSENPDLRYAIPKEGSIIFIDNVAIPKNAPHKELAEKFINFINEPEMAAKISNFTQYGTPNKTALDKGLIDAKALKNTSIYPTPEVFERLHYNRDVGQANKLYDQAWTEIKTGVGN